MKNLIDLIEYHSRNDPSKIAIITKKSTLTFKELSQQSSLFANSLKDFSKNSVISLMFENSTNFVISYIGTLKAGLIAHILPITISEKNLLFQIESANSELLVTENYKFDDIKDTKLPIKIKKFDEQIFKFETKTHEIFPDDNAHLLYTSGTTAEPKGVPITHSNLIFTIKNIISVLGYSSSDVSLSPLPLHHSFGLGCLNTSLYSGGQIILLNNASDLSDILQTIRKFNATIFSAVPATLIKLLKFYKNDIKIEFKDLRLIMTNSTSIPPETVLEYKKILNNGNLTTYYGLTEASRSTFMMFKNNLDKDSSVGKPAPDVKIKIENKNNNIGEIWIKGGNVINQYWNNQSNQNFDDEWLKTGDLGYFDKDGFLYLSGRLDDVINVGGEKVFPEYVEKIIKKMNDIEEVVVIGQKHEVFGQTVKALVKLNPHSTLKKSDILSFCIKNLEKFMVPTKIELKNEIPKTDFGKIKRFILQSEDLNND
jgi:long-chain acyl-CoA synthetase